MKLVNSYIIKDYFDKEYKVYPVIRKYKNNKRLAILLVLTEDEWFCDLTVNINNDQSCKNNRTLAFVDINNNPWAEKFIKDNKLGEPTGFYGLSGYCIYPEYKFDLKKLNKWSKTEK